MNATSVDVIACPLKSKLLSFPAALHAEDEDERARFALYALQRRELLSTRRALALGLGTPATQRCAIPPAAIIVMPAAFAGGELLAHETLRTT